MLQKLFKLNAQRLDIIWKKILKYYLVPSN